VRRSLEVHSAHRASGPDPIAGLREMRRVARRVVAFTHDASDTGWRHPFWQLPQTCR